MATKVFDYRLLRLLMGVVAVSLPIIVDIRSSEPLASISASYHTEARDLFVGLLFVVGALLVAYRGHTTTQNWTSNLAALTAVGIALFSVSEKGEPSTLESIIHYVCAAIMFVILAWFCLGPFRNRALKSALKGGLKPHRRARIYTICGSVIIAAIILMGLAFLIVSEADRQRWEMVYWLESIALWAFGFAWITAGKVVPFLVDTNEALFANQAAQLSD